MDIWGGFLLLFFVEKIVKFYVLVNNGRFQ
jgi:hypothetical protein